MAMFHKKKDVDWTIIFWENTHKNNQSKIQELTNNSELTFSYQCLVYQIGQPSPQSPTS